MSESLRRSFHAVVWYVGVASIFIGFVLLVPLAVLFVWPEEATLAPSYALPSLFVMTAGYLACFNGTNEGAPSLNRKEAGTVIVLVWILAILANALPLLLSGLLSPVHALFEATSGLTTTGFTVVEVDSCPRTVLLHRSLMHYLGGVGLILVMACAISDSRGLGLYNAEGHADRLLAGSARSARAILILYTGLIALGAFLYKLEGMPVFDAVNIAVSAVSTGGFAVRGDSLASYDSFAVEATTVVLMLAGASNFLLNFMLLQGRFRSVLKHVETPAFFGIVAASSVLVALGLSSVSEDADFLPFLRTAVFHVVSVMTSTGLQTTPTEALLVPSVSFVFLALMFVGGEAGSTAGGIKVFRIVVYLKSIIWNIRDKVDHSRRVHSDRLNRFGRQIECTSREQLATHSFIGAYVAVFGICAFAFTICGASAGEAIYDAAACLGNTGLGCGFVGADSSPAVLVVSSVTMLFGRLEIMPIVLGFVWVLRVVKRSVKGNAFLRKSR